jgi:hypothetical protein
VLPANPNNSTDVMAFSRIWRHGRVEGAHIDLDDKGPGKRQVIVSITLVEMNLTQDFDTHDSDR